MAENELLRSASSVPKPPLIPNPHNKEAEPRQWLQYETKLAQVLKDAFDKRRGEMKRVAEVYGPPVPQSPIWNVIGISGLFSKVGKMFATSKLPLPGHTPSYPTPKLTPNPDHLRGKTRLEPVLETW